MDQPLLEEAFRAVEQHEEEQEEEISDDTYSLLYVGYLTDSVTVGSHEIRIRTLKIGEELNAALLANKYRDTVEEGRALATALIAGAITSVDGEPLLGQALGPGQDTLQARFDYILNNWYWETAKQVWSAYNELLKRVQASAEELKKD